MLFPIFLVRSGNYPYRIVRQLVVVDGLFLPLAIRWVFVGPVWICVGLINFVCVPQLHICLLWRYRHSFYIRVPAAIPQPLWVSFSTPISFIPASASLFWGIAAHASNCLAYILLSTASSSQQQLNCFFLQFLLHLLFVILIAHPRKVKSSSASGSLKLPCCWFPFTVEYYSEILDWASFLRVVR